jgi:hypothetical protein
MSNQLPLKIRVDIREFDNPTSEIQKRLASLTKEVGLPCTHSIEWLSLWTALKPSYPDPAQFVPSITHTLTLLIDGILDNLADDSWAESLLADESVERKQELNLTVLALQDKANLGKVIWMADKATVAAMVPLGGGQWSKIPVESLKGLWDAPSEEATKAAASGRGPAVVLQDEDWADVGVPEHRGTVSVNASGPGPEVVRVERLPQIDRIPRPDILFAEAPYLCTVRQLGNGVRVNCSHEGTLKVMSSYFERFIRHNHHDAERVSIKCFLFWSLI